MRYKVGDKVRIKSLEWYNKNKDFRGIIELPETLCFNRSMATFCGKVCTISEVHEIDGSYAIDESQCKYYWFDWMFDENYKGEKDMEENKKNELNLCEILKGCEGMEFYLTTHGYCTLDEIKTGAYDYPIRLKVYDKKNNEETRMISAKGTASVDYYGECILFPSKEQRDWSKFEKPIPIDTPFMCSDLGKLYDFSVRLYAGIDEDGHYTFTNGGTSKEHESTCHWKYMIPFDKFNPNNIEESLKYNIQK